MKTINTPSIRIAYLNASFCNQPLAYHSSEKGTTVDKELNCYNSEHMSITAPWPPRAFDIWVLLLCIYTAQHQESNKIVFRSIRSILKLLGKNTTNPKYYDYVEDSLNFWSEASIHAEKIFIPEKDRYKMRDTSDHKDSPINKHEEVYINQVFVSTEYDSISGEVRIELNDDWLKLCVRKPLAPIDIDAAMKIQAPYSLNFLLYLSAYRQEIIKVGNFPRKILYLAKVLGIQNADVRPIKELYRMIKKAGTDVSTATGIPYKFNPKLNEELINITIDQQPANSDKKFCIHNITSNTKLRKRLKTAC